MTDIAGAREQLAHLLLGENNLEAECNMEARLKVFYRESKKPVFPMSDNYIRNKFFVRQCYLDRSTEIDEYVHDYVDGEGLINILLVIGTPGIGTSLFYVYYAMECVNNYGPVICMSFNKNGSFKAAYLITKAETSDVGRRSEELKYRRTKMSLKDVEESEINIVLVDGPGEVEFEGKMTIVFSSPNDKLLHKSQNNTALRKIYLPPWTLEELRFANKNIPVGIPDDELQRRFNYFGGVARVCLENDHSKYLEHESYFSSGINSIDSEEYLSKLFVQNTANSEIVHRIFHIVPEETDYKFHYELCSDAAFDRILDNLKQKSKSLTAAFYNAINPLATYKSIVGHMNERWMIHQLKLGLNIDIKCRSLKSNSSSVLPACDILYIPKEYHEFEFVDPLDSTLEASRTKLLLPKSKNFPTVDAFYFSEAENTLYGLQFTVSSGHSVKVKGLLDMLHLTGLMKTFVEDETMKIRIVFLVPSLDFEGFKTEQKINYDKLVKYGDWAAVKSLKDIDGVTGKTLKVLSDNNRTVEKIVSDLEKGLNLDMYPVAVKRFFRYMKQLSQIGDLFDRKLEQFVGCYKLDEVIQA
ncbi:hypothetical protein MP638_004256 [Amoeboaphelidium occidentale]|nr:hypothetical protein MP638_004256 [Amoeboaphelidium occidentale]